MALFHDEELGALAAGADQPAVFRQMSKPLLRRFITVGYVKDLGAGQYHITVPGKAALLKRANPGKRSNLFGLLGKATPTGPRYELTERSGKKYVWTRAQLDDTLLENEHWDKSSVRARIKKLKPGQSMTINGERLTRLKETKKSKNKEEPTPRNWDIHYKKAYFQGRHLITIEAGTPQDAFRRAQVLAQRGVKGLAGLIEHPRSAFQITPAQQQAHANPRARISRLMR